MNGSLALELVYVLAQGLWGLVGAKVRLYLLGVLHEIDDLSLQSQKK